MGQRLIVLNAGLRALNTLYDMYIDIYNVYTYLLLLLLLLLLLFKVNQFYLQFKKKF